MPHYSHFPPMACPYCQLISTCGSFPSHSCTCHASCHLQQLATVAPYSPLLCWEDNSGNAKMLKMFILNSRCSNKSLVAMSERRTRHRSGPGRQAVFGKAKSVIGSKDITKKKNEGKWRDVFLTGSAIQTCLKTGTSCLQRQRLGPGAQR